MIGRQRHRTSDRHQVKIGTCKFFCTVNRLQHKNILLSEEFLLFSWSSVYQGNEISWKFWWKIQVTRIFHQFCQNFISLAIMPLSKKWRKSQKSEISLKLTSIKGITKSSSAASVSFYLSTTTDNNKCSKASCSSQFIDEIRGSHNFGHAMLLLYQDTSEDILTTL